MNFIDRSSRWVSTNLAVGLGLLSTLGGACQKQSTPTTNPAATPNSPASPRESRSDAPRAAPGVAKTPLPLLKLEQLPEPLRKHMKQPNDRAAAHPDDPQVVGEFGMACFVNDLPTAAAASFTRAQELDAKSLRWAYYLALTYEQSEETRDQAIRSFDRALAIDSNYAPALNQQALLILNNDARRAERLFRRAMEINEKDVVALRGMARCRRLAGRHDMALDYARRALALAPNYADANLEMSLLLKEAGKADEADEYSRRFKAGEPPPLELDPLRKELLSSTGNTTDLLEATARASRTGDTARTFDLLKLAIEKETTGNEARATLATFCLRRGQPAQAEQILRDICKRAPGDFNARSLWAFSLVEVHRPDEAERIYGDVLASHPDDVPTLGRLGVLMLLRGRPAEALQPLQRFVRLLPDQPDQRANLALALACNKRFDEAVTEFKRAVDAAADKGFRMNGMANRLIALAMSQEQRGSAASRPTTTPTTTLCTPEDFLSLGEALQRAQLPSEAVSAFTNAVRLDPKLVRGYRLLLAQLRATGTEKDEAELLRRAVAGAPEVPEFSRELSLLLSTAADDGVRNGVQAREIAEQLCRRSQFKDPADLLPLAAAYAEAKDFEQAIDIAQTAKKHNPPPEIAKELDRCLDLFHKKRPVRRPERNEATD